MPRKPYGIRKSTVRRARSLSQLDPYLRALFERDGEPNPADAERGDPFLQFELGEEGLHREWKRWREPLLAEWIARRPGTRPWAWWRYDAPEPERRRLGGKGIEMCEQYLGYTRAFDFGIPRYWHQIDPAQPPLYESEAAYLQRHNLLTPSEARELTADDFQPEVIHHEGEDAR
jgi:hypothetical protein